MGLSTSSGGWPFRAVSLSKTSIPLGYELSSVMLRSLPAMAGATDSLSLEAYQLFARGNR